MPEGNAAHAAQTGKRRGAEKQAQCGRPEFGVDVAPLVGDREQQSRPDARRQGEADGRVVPGQVARGDVHAVQSEDGLGAVAAEAAAHTAETIKRREGNARVVSHFEASEALTNSQRSTVRKPHDGLAEAQSANNDANTQQESGEEKIKDRKMPQKSANSPKRTC